MAAVDFRWPALDTSHHHHHHHPLRHHHRRRRHHRRSRHHLHHLPHCMSWEKNSDISFTFNQKKDYAWWAKDLSERGDLEHGKLCCESCCGSMHASYPFQFSISWNRCPKNVKSVTSKQHPAPLKWHGLICSDLGHEGNLIDSGGTKGTSKQGQTAS